VIGAVRHLNGELTGAGAVAHTNRFPQPRLQTVPAQAERVHPAPAGKALTGV
jgi:hypothetical protein